MNKTAMKLRLHWPILGLSLVLGSCIALRAQTPPAAEITDTDKSPYHLALLDYNRGNFDKARAEIDEAEKAKPDDSAVKILKARILTEQHEFDAGEKLLRPLLAPTGAGSLDTQIALADLLLRRRDYDGAARFYGLALGTRHDDPDLTLKLIYTRVGASDFVTAGKYASHLKPLESTPAYYFAQAALAQATGKSNEADQDIETVRTVYGIATANRYLKTYFEVFAPGAGPSSTPASRAEPPKASATPPPPAAKP